MNRTQLRTLHALEALFAKGMQERTAGAERERWKREEDAAVDSAYRLHSTVSCPYVGCDIAGSHSHETSSGDMKEVTRG